MIKSLIILLIIANIEINTSLEAEKKFIYDVENPFDKDNNEFTFEYNGADESTYYLLIINTKSKLSYRYSCEKTKGADIVNIGSFAIVLNLKKESCKIEIKPYEDSEVKGTIMIHPLNIETKVDFNKQEKYGFEGSITSKEKCPPITFSISNLNEDVLVKFTYSYYTIVFKDKSVSLANPFKVCLKDDCQENVKTYKFLKGNNYKIYADFTEVTSTYHEIPPHSFEKIIEGDEDDQDNKEVQIIKKRLRGSR